MRLLLVEDHGRLTALIREGLEDAGFDVDAVTTASAALQAIACHHYDGLILDLGLPDEDGLTVLTRLRADRKAIPVLILTSRIGVAERVKGLDSGADDYLTKPFAMAELVARIRALLRRPHTALGPVLNLGDLSFDSVSRELRAGGAPVHLPRKEAHVLEQLMRRGGKVVPKAMIEQSLYGVEDELSSNSVEVVVHRLRKKLSDAGVAARIHTVRGIGYMLLEGSE